MFLLDCDSEETKSSSGPPASKKHQPIGLCIASLHCRSALLTWKMLALTFVGSRSMITVVQTFPNFVFIDQVVTSCTEFVRAMESQGGTELLKYLAET